MRLQNPHAMGQVYTNKPAKPDKLIGNTKFLITVQFVMMLVLLTWVATDLFLSYGAPDAVLRGSLSPVGSIQQVDVLLTEQRKLLQKFAEANAIQRVENATELKSMATTATQEIFANIQNGDYFIKLPGNQLIIYRPDTEENVYVGMDADAALAVMERNIAKEIFAAASAAKIIEGKQEPLVREIADIATLLRQDPTLFENAKNGDFIAYFPNEFVTVIYNPQAQEIVQSATIEYQL